MRKQWYPQQNVLDSPIALLKNFIYYLKYPVSKITIEDDMKSFPDYPLNISLATYMKLLEKWGVKYKAFKCGIENLKDIASPSILFIKDEKDNKTGNFVMFYNVKENEIEYLHTAKGWVLESLEEFAKKYGGVALSAQSIAEGENDFEEKEKQYEVRKKSNPDLINVMVKDNFLTDEECSYIINLSTPEFKRSKLMASAGSNFEDNYRTSSSAELHVFPKDEILNGIRKRAAELIKMPESNFEFFQCLYYDKGQEFDVHYDTFDGESEKGKQTILEGGQRKYTLFAYLNDDFEGGCTYFPNLDLLVEPKKKSIIIFNNLDENGKVIKAALHAGLPVTTGRKYGMNMWVRSKPVR